MRSIFENAIEKLGRILASQYHIQVRFEADKAYTDGKSIVLPYMKELTEEMYQDLNGYLDHEVAHCKFTDFSQVPKVISRFHKELLNCAEDSRIEIEMVKEFPGAANYLDPLNTKLVAKLHEGWGKLPWPIRLILGVRDLMEGKKARIDADTKDQFALISEDAKKLSKLNTTEELRVATEAMVKKIAKLEDEKKKEKESGEGEKGESSEKSPEKGEKKKDSTEKSREKGEKGEDEGESEDGESEDSDSEDGESDAKPERGESGESESSEGSEASEGEDGEPTKKSAAKKREEKKAAERREKETEMLKESTREKDSEFDEHVRDIHSLINEELEEAVEKEERTTRVMGKREALPFTTRYDEVKELSGKGDLLRYAQLKRSVQPLINPVRTELEKILKVRENARWEVEKERGRINPQSLGKFATDKNFRTPFKEFTQDETKNVAIEILIDQSASMTGKIHTAKLAVTAMSEALKSLSIPFEVTGFHTQYDTRMSTSSREVEGSGRFTRLREKLMLTVFKNFECQDLKGIEKLTTGSENQDGECVWWAAKRLAQRPEKRKVLIVMSDGFPACGEGRYDDLNYDLKKKVEKIISSGMEVIGIGIHSEAVRHFYPDYVVINDIAELPAATMKKLTSIILNDRKKKTVRDVA